MKPTKEELLAQRREYRKKHPEIHRRYNPRWKLCHRDKCKAGNDRYRKENRQKINARAKSRRDNNRIMVLSHYGNRCVCCGESHREFLAVDHINNDGALQRRKHGIFGNTLILWIIKNNFPAHYQILCHNCNVAKAIYGKCPHKSHEIRDFGEKITPAPGEEGK